MSAAPGSNADPGSAGFPFDEAMTAGFALLGLSSAAFRAMTPREFARALAPFGTRFAAPMGRGDLATLMTRFPDDPRR